MKITKKEKKIFIWSIGNFLESPLGRMKNENRYYDEKRPGKVDIVQML